MLVQFIHKDSGKLYTMEVTQVVVCTDGGSPVAIAYERSGMVVYTDAGRNDFDSTCSDLKIKPIPAKS